MTKRTYKLYISDTNFNHIVRELMHTSTWVHLDIEAHENDIILFTSEKTKKFVVAKLSHISHIINFSEGKINNSIALLTFFM
jgi:hypothetical protein